MFIEPHGKVHSIYPFTYSLSAPSFLSFFPPLFPSSFQLGIEETRGVPSQEGKQKSSICGSFPQVHKAQFLNEILNHKGHRWVEWWFEISRGCGVCYFTIELNIIVIEGSSWIKRNYLLGSFKTRKCLKCKPQNEDNLKG